MDAKPQRIRVRGDENAPVALPASKTLHQRNKSASALLGVPQTGTFKGSVLNRTATTHGARRAAFGDVSNTANPVQGSRDDSALAGKKQPQKGGLAPEKKPATAVLNQPPQRPQSLAGVRGLLSQAGAPTTTTTTTTTAQPKPFEQSGKQMSLSSQQSANTRKILNKRSATTVFKDPAQSTSTSTLSEIKQTTASKEIPNIDASDDSNDVVSRPTTALTLEEVHTEEDDGDETVSETRSRDDDDGDDDEDSSSVIHHSAADDDDNASLIEDELQVQEPEEPADTVADARRVVSEAKAGGGGDSKQRVASLHAADHESAEEYWDEEDEENDENEEEDDGYVTARSYRSRGDNTTGATTTLLVPKFNQRVKRELLLAKQIVEATQTEEDIEDELWDTSMVAEYSDEIFGYMKEQEIKMLPNSHYMDYQVEVQWSMRSILMDWVVQVHYRFSLLPETLYLCVNYIDRFLSCKIISLDRLQLVGATALFIAAKFEEINCPSVQEIEYMVGGAYSADRIIEAERLMLYVLQFELGFPGPMSFLRRISKADDYDLEIRTLAKYLLEITIMDERFVSSPASFLAAGAHCLARLLLGGNWSPAHVHYSGYTYSQLLPLVSLLLECCENPRQHHSAIFEKYGDKRFRHAALFVQGELKYFRLPDAKDNTVFKRSSPLEAARSWDRA